MKENTLKLYVKLVFLQISQVFRFIGMIGLMAFTAKKIYFVGRLYINTGAFPPIIDLIKIAALIGVVITLGTLKNAIGAKCLEFKTTIENKNQLKKWKAELQLKHAECTLKENRNSSQTNAMDTTEPTTVQNTTSHIREFAVEKFSPRDTDTFYSLIGLDSVKKQIRKIQATVQYEREQGGIVPHTYHMRFYGNPGTGKTSVAKAIGAILYEAGVLKKPHIVSVNGNDLMGQYTGQTAPTVDAAFAKAKDGLLFIDEAYAFAQSAYDGRGYGMEAVTQLLTHLENPENTTTVIFGGYGNEMEWFFNMNPGLRSRVPNTICFPDYTPNELYEIMLLNLRNWKHEISNDIQPMLLNVFYQKIQTCAENNTPFSNGRYARNVAIAIHEQHAERYCDNKTIGSTITLSDININDLLQLD